MATCRECKLWNREQAMDKAGRIRKDRARTVSLGLHRDLANVGARVYKSQANSRIHGGR